MSSNPDVNVEECVGHRYPVTTVKYNRRDVILYALGIGAKELKFIYENDSDFCVFPTYPVCWSFKGDSFDVVQFGSNQGGFPGLNFNPMNILHGEESIEIMQSPLPLEAELEKHGHIKALYDKGSGAVVVLETDYKDVKSGKVLVREQSKVFIRGLGNFGGERGPSTPSSIIPKRAPDFVEEEQIPDQQAMLYRLSGDYNPLHADPSMAEFAGFKKPILHGLASFGYAVRAILKRVCDNNVSRLRKVSVRFSKPVIPGDTLRTEIWRDGANSVIFQSSVRGKPVISNATCELNPSAKL